jgi:membrane protein DedA with SNARE-associated domain
VRALEAALAWAEARPAAVLALVFVLAAIEAVPVLGWLFPAAIVLVAAAAAGSAADVPVAEMLAAALAGAVLGDGLAYWLGGRYGARLLAWPAFARHGAALTTAAEWVGRRGALAVFGGRFMPGLRAVAPFAAGMLGLRAVPFWVANGIGSLLWAPAHVLSGAALPDIFVWLKRHDYALAGLAALALAGAAWWYLRRRVDQAKS